MSDEWGLTKDLMLGDEHLGQKVYQIKDIYGHSEDDYDVYKYELRA